VDNEIIGITVGEMTRCIAQYIEKYVAIINPRSHAHMRKDKITMKSEKYLECLYCKVLFRN
jgi:hypothetical protein